MAKIKYESNNSGGNWWLSDDDWRNLEKNGWDVDWDQFLGSLAQSASKDFPSMKEAIEEWESITGKDASAEGCNCCGPPHLFINDETDEFYSGEEILDVLYETTSLSKRELMEKVCR